MSLVAASGFAALIPLLFVLACPLMMVFMMRGMHGHGHGAREQHAPDQMTLDELKRERDALNEQIADRAEQITDRRREAASR